MKYFSSVLLFAAFFLVTASAQAELQVKLDLLYGADKEGEAEPVNPVGNDDVSVTNLNYKGGAGWLLELGSGHVFLGGAYFNQSEQTQQKPHDGSPSSTQKDTISGFGPLLGYQIKNFDIEFMYYISPSFERTSTGNPTEKYSDSSGFEVSLGYLLPIGKTFAIGPRVIHQQLSWDKRSAGGATASLVQPQEFSDTKVYLAMELNFMK